MSNEFGGSTIDVSLREYVGLVYRRRAIILQTIVLMVAVGFVLNLVTKPRYRSSSRILLEGKSTAMATYDAGNPLAGLLLQDSGHDINTQIGVIQGEEVIADACKAAGIPVGSVQTSVVQVPGTDLIDISAESENPRYATALARALPATYRDHVNKNQKSEIKAAHQLAQGQLADEQKKLTTLRERLATLREQSQVFSVDDDRKTRGSAAAEAASALLDARTAYATAQAQLNTLLAQRKNLPAYIESTTETTNPDIAVIKANIATLVTQREGLLVLLKHTSPKVEALDNQIKDLQAHLDAAPLNVATVTKKPNEDLAACDRKISETRVALASAESALQTANAQTNAAKENLVKYGSDEQSQAQVEEDVERTKAKVLLLTKTEEDLHLRDIAMHDPVSVVAPARPAVKVSPKPALNLLFTSLTGIVLGMCFALLQEFLDDRVNSPEHVKGLISAPTLGFVPLIEVGSGLLAPSKSIGALMESYRVLRSNVGFATVDSTDNALLVTSTLPGEGKSTTAVNLASAMALDGKSVIVVDLDLRKPTVHEKLGLGSTVGVTDVLMGRSTLDAALQNTQFAGLRVLSSGPLPPNPAELMSSQAMKRMLEQIRGMADVVVIDSPPFLATADAQILSSLVDGVVFVVQFGVARKPELRHAQSLLQQANGKMLGVVFNKIDVSSNRDYSYGVYQHYTDYNGASQDDTDNYHITNIAFKNVIAQIERSEPDNLPAETASAAASSQSAAGSKPKG